MDVAYLLDFNHPANDLFRGRSTTAHVDALDLNMAAAYVNKKASDQSRWGAELTIQAGKDSEDFAFSATAPELPGAKWLRHLGLADVSYLAPVGQGLTVQGGIFASLIGYDGLYAKDNLNYTRPWGADLTPYLMLGVNASYPWSPKFTTTVFLINGYSHLSDANHVPSLGSQFAYKATPRVTLKETFLAGPQQSNTSFPYWGVLSDSIAEHRTDRATFAFEYIYETERLATPVRNHALLMAGQLPMHWSLGHRWSTTIRPEFLWDPQGQWTLSRQTIKAITSTLEYRIPYRRTTAILRMEHRYDDSRGPDGGFYRGAEGPAGNIALTPVQHLLIAALIWTFDSP